MALVFNLLPCNTCRFKFDYKVSLVTDTMCSKSFPHCLRRLHWIRRRFISIDRTLERRRKDPEILVRNTGSDDMLEKLS